MFDAEALQYLFNYTGEQADVSIAGLQQTSRCVKSSIFLLGLNGPFKGGCLLVERERFYNSPWTSLGFLSLFSIQHLYIYSLNKYIPP